MKKNGKVRPQHAVWFYSVENKTVQNWLDDRWQSLRPLTMFPETSNPPPRRITLVTDSVGPTSLFGGVATGLILAAQWAERTESDLRIVTRTETPVTTALSGVLAVNDLQFSGAVEYLHAPDLHTPHVGAAEIAVSDRDLFLATSWWSARCLLNSVPADRIVYLLQEDERMFYPLSDDHLMCSQTLAEPFGFVVLNSGLLHRHLTTGDDAVPGLETRSMAFEPAFHYPRAPRPERASDEKRKLFFYARPNNSRNLYATGMALLNQAALRGVIDPVQWEVHLVGRDLEHLLFDNGLSAVYHDPMPWQDYMRFQQDMDAGLSLMYTPHPSYPPLDLATMGIPVLSNRFGLKTGLEMYSNNIVTADLDMDSLLDGMERLMALADDPDAVARNLDGDHINRDWTAALAPVIDRLAELSDAEG
ncbi:rhamnosyltransferase WsaF family glycosyltransferase [Ruegeria sp. HKCCE4150]|uniref:rhamnosyltransferase WsaF family glycosyltransferase n=1 Tax=Ruegeria sp. HKCCE4150 TaxID=2794828 RepID=UPI001AE7567E|nr:hypothetical protein [Ruegeria sp. HKCCE4150]